MAEDESSKRELTKWLARGKKDPQEKSRLQSREQMALYDAYLFVGNVYEELAFFLDLAAMDMVNMMAHQGKRSEEITDSLGKMYEMETQKAGLRGVLTHLRSQNQEGEG